MATSSINTMVHSALTNATAYGRDIEGLRTALKGQDVPAMRVTLMPSVAGFYKVALVARERGEGVVMDVNATKYEAAKKALQRLVKDIAGNKGSQREELSVPANILEAARKLVALCAEYESASRLLATAVATAKAE